MTTYLAANDIFAVDDAEYAEVDCRPHWPGVLLLRCPTSAAVQAWARAQDPDTGGKDATRAQIQSQAALIQRCAVTARDKDAPLAFRPDQIEMLSKRSAAPVTKCFAAIMKMVKVSDAALKEFEENFPETPDAGMHSD